MNLRLFVAIELPATTRARLIEIQQQLQRDPALAGLRWVRPEGIHLTLKFLGETPEEKQTGIEESLSAAASGVKPFEVRLGKLGRFGSPHSPRVLWVDVAGDTASLSRLQANIESQLAPLGFPPESRAFSAHLTLARVPPEQARGAAVALEAAMADTVVPESLIPVDEISLMQSVLRPGGAVYTQLFAAPLV